MIKLNLTFSEAVEVSPGAAGGTISVLVLQTGVIAGASTVVSVAFGAQNTVTTGWVEVIGSCTCDGVAFTNAVVAVELLITDSAGEYEPSDTTIFLTPSAPMGQVLAGVTTARLTQRTDSNGQFKIALYEPTPSIKYLWLKASGNEQYLITAKNGILEVTF